MNDLKVSPYVGVVEEQTGEFLASHPWWKVVWCPNCNHRNDEHVGERIRPVGRCCTGCRGCFHERALEA